METKWSLCHGVRKNPRYDIGNTSCATVLFNTPPELLYLRFVVLDQMLILHFGVSPLEMVL